MRELSATLEAAQKLLSIPAKIKVVLTDGEDTYTYEESGDNAITAIKDLELQPWSQKATVILSNSDKVLNDIALQGFQAAISFGATTSEGDEYSAQPPLWVFRQRFDSSPSGLPCELTLIGIPNRMAQDKAKSSLQPEADDSTSVKDYVDAIAGATQGSFDHCQAYTVTWDDESGSTYTPKDNFRIFVGDNRLDKIRELLEYTKLQFSVEDDGYIHIFLPTTSGESYDYEYSLTTDAHMFFAKAYQSTLVVPNKVTVQSYSDEDNQYSGSATSTASHDLMPIEWTIEKYSLASDAEAQTMAEAMIANAELWANAGSATVPINVGAEVFDYVQVTDARNGDTRTGNVGTIRINYRAEVGGQESRWEMAFSFGDWTTLEKVLGGLGTSITELQRYFTRLMVKNLYAEYIYAEQIDVNYLSALTAHMGLLTGGEIKVGVGDIDADGGTATGGSNTTLQDTSKAWEIDEWAEKEVRILIDVDTENAAYPYYSSIVVSNTANTLTFINLPSGVSVSNGDDYGLGGGTFTGIRIWPQWTYTETGYVGLIAGYNDGNIQFYAGSDGKLYAGDGAVYMDSTGLSIIGNVLKLLNSDSSKTGYFYLGDDGDVALVPHTDRRVWVNGHLQLASGKYIGPMLESEDAEVIWYDNSGTYNHALRPETDGKGKLGTASKKFYGGYFKERLYVPGGPEGTDLYD